MSIIRVASRNRFLLVAQETVDDLSISWEAKGLHFYLLGRPDNWVVKPEKLSELGGAGRDKIYRLLKELVSAQYVKRLYLKDDAGRNASVEYVVYETKQIQLPENPDTDKPDTEKPEVGQLPGKPDTAEPDTENQDAITNTKKQTNTKTKKFSHEDFELAREMFEQVAADFPSTKADLDAWADCVRMLREVEGLTYGDIRGIWSFARQDSFWASNCKSPGKLRARDKEGTQYFDRLRTDMLKRGRNGQAGSSGNGNQSRRSSASADVSEIAARERAKLAAARSGSDYRPVGADDALVRAQMDQPVRQGDRSGERMGSVIEGSCERAS